MKKLVSACLCAILLYSCAVSAFAADSEKSLFDFSDSEASTDIQVVSGKPHTAGEINLSPDTAVPLKPVAEVQEAESVLSELLSGLTAEITEEGEIEIRLRVKPENLGAFLSGLMEELSNLKNNGDTAEVILDPEVSPINVYFEALEDRNKDIIGWLFCPNTMINYPIVQAEDNMYYLHRDIDGNYSSYGTLFVDCTCKEKFHAENCVIYGHHMADGKMFANLINYRSQMYFDEHPVMYLNTPEMNYRIELFSGYVTSMESNTFQMNFNSKEEKQNWLDGICNLSEFSSDVNVTSDDMIITLSTCTYDYDDARFVVHGKLVPIH